MKLTGMYDKPHPEEEDETEVQLRDEGGSWLIDAATIVAVYLPKEN